MAIVACKRNIRARTRAREVKCTTSGGFDGRVPQSTMQLVKKDWEIIADNLSKAGWSLGWVSALDLERRTIWIASAQRGDGKRFIVHADEKLTAFLELERAVCVHLFSEPC